MTAMYLTFAACLVAIATARRLDWVTGTIACGLILSAVMIASEPASPLPFIAAIDGMTCAAMAAVWTVHNSMRAWSVGAIGLAKTGGTLVAYLADPFAVHWGFAVALNLAFLAQVLVAGGWADGLGSRLDRVFARLAPKRRSLLRDGSR